MYPVRRMPPGMSDESLNTPEMQTLIDFIVLLW